MRIKPLVYICALCLSVSGAALAFDAAAPDDASNPAPATKPSVESGTAARSAKSIECSQKADAQNLRGKPRKHFIHECKRGA